MRILIVSDAWAPQINGVVRTYQRTLLELKNLGHEADVIGPDQFRTIPCPSYPEIRLAINALWALPPKIKAWKPDAVHVATEGPLGSAARRYCLKRGIPFTTSFHTRFPEYVEARTRIPASLTYKFLRRFHQPSRNVLVPTGSMIEALEGYGFDNLHLWSRGVDTELFRPAKTEADRNFLNLPRPIYANIGRVAVEKNIRQFLDLNLDGTKMVVGDGPMLNTLKAEYPDVVFTGAKTGQELVRHYQAADVFVFPSRTDTFGLVLLEAMACGVPVAALPVTGPLDVVANSGAGVLSEDLAEAARQALELSRKRAREYAVTFSWERSARQFLDGLYPLPGSAEETALAVPAE